MAEIELADQQVAEQPETGVHGAEIPDKVSEKPTSIREALTASIKEVGEKEQRARDIASGKFIPKEDKAPAKVEAKESSKEVVTSPSERPQQDANPEAAPSSWGKSDVPVWNTLSQEAKAIVRKREADFLKGIEKYTQKSTQYDDLDRVLAPSRAVYQQFGAKTDAEAVSRLIEWEAALRSNPAAGIQRLAQQLGIDLSQLARPPSQDGAPDPLRPVLDQFGQLSQTVNSVQSQIQAWQQEQVAKDLAAFSKDKPHFERLRVSMGQLMQAGIVKPDDLEGAYQKALNLDDELREQMASEKEEARKAELAKTQAEQAKQARLAAVSPAPKARQGMPPVQDKSSKGVRASLLATISELRDRA